MGKRNNFPAWARSIPLTLLMTEIEACHITTSSKLVCLIQTFPASASPGSAKVHQNVNSLGALCSLGQAGYLCPALKPVVESSG